MSRPPIERMGAVVLAAGASTRFAGPVPKQLVTIDGEPMVRRVVRRVVEAGFGDVVVVVGSFGAEVEKALAGLPVRIVSNPDWAAGQGGSVGRGVAALDEDLVAVCFVPADLPELRSSTLRQLAAAFDPPRHTIVVPTVAGVRRAPVVFGGDYRIELAALGGDAGGRQLLGRHADRVVEVEIAEARELDDVDTVGDLDRF